MTVVVGGRYFILRLILIFLVLFQFVCWSEYHYVYASEEMSIVFYDNELRGGEKVELNVRGGAPPYIWTVEAGEITYKADTGEEVYLTAPEISGDFNVTVMDSKGNVAKSSFSVEWEGFSISPQYLYLLPEDETSIFFHNPEGAVNVYPDAGDWEYLPDKNDGIRFTAPSSTGFYSIVFQDEAGEIRYCHVKVYDSLQLLAGVSFSDYKCNVSGECDYYININDTSPVSLTVTGGVAPYLWIEGGKGELNQIMGDSVWYTPGTLRGEDKVQVYDNAGNVLNIIFYYPSHLSCSTIRHTVVIDDEVTFTAMGGTPPYNISLPSQGNYKIIDDSSGQSKTVAFTATGKYEAVISDAVGGVAFCNVEVIEEALKIDPSGNVRIRPRSDGTIEAITLTVSNYNGNPVWICQGPCADDVFTPSTTGTTVVFHPPSEGFFEIVAQDETGAEASVMVTVYSDIYNYYAGKDLVVDVQEMEEAINDLFGAVFKFTIPEFYYLVERFMTNK